MFANNLEVTDDVSIVEALKEPVKLTLGQYTNIKLTTPDDLLVAEQVLTERGVRDDSKKGDSSDATTRYPCSSEAYRQSLEKGKTSE